MDYTSFRAAWSARLGPLLFATLIAFVAAPAAAGILVVSPHPDDDIIMAAGVVAKAVGYEEVTVVYVTNGDYNGVSTGLMRQGEAVAAQTQHLGTAEDNLIFLGYPDGQIRRLFGSYPNANQQYFTSYGQGTTYGNRGLGRMDYHRYRFGSSAAYNAANVVLDLRTILSTYRPSHIFSTSQYDAHEDHAYTYHAIRQALAQLNASDPTYTPVLHSTIIWTSDPVAWPTASNPRQRHTTMPGLGQTPFSWAERESLDVPPSMQDWNLMANPKYRAIYSHASQANQTGFITRWAHKDEVFWAESPHTANQPPVAEAGNDVSAAAGATATLNGSASHDPDDDPLTYAWRQVQGPATTLIDANTANPSFQVPAGLAADTFWAFELRVSDGALTSAADLVRVTGQVSTPDVTGLASVTASSAATAAEQFASKAVDGLVGGHPFDYRLEWASNREKAGAWLRLTWPQSMNIDRVQLFDRPGSNDRMTGATLTFSDGSTIPVPALQNDAVVGTVVSFAPRTTTSVTVTATGASESTKSVGLAEIVAYGVQAVPTAPSAPSALSAAASSHTQINLAWTDNASNEAGFRVERSANGVTFATIATLAANASTYSDSGLAPATVYYYRVLAFNGVGDSGTSNVASAATQSAPSAPAAPSGLSGAAVSSSQVNLGWVDNSGNETGFRVERSLDGGNFAAVATLAANATTYSDGGVAAGSTYYYRVYAFNAIGDSGYSNVTAVTTPAAPVPPSAPSGLTAASVSASQINLNWTDNASNETGYRVERSTDGATFTVIANLGVDANSHASTGLAPSTLYYYRVVAFNVAGDSAHSNVASATTQSNATVPASPSGLAVATASSSQLNLSWTDNASNESGYRVERSIDGSSFAVVASLAQGATTYADGGLAASTLYHYRVVAFNAVGNSGYSNVASGTTASPPPVGTNVAPMAAVTASSERPNSNQQAIKAVDGVISGYPADHTREWATVVERVGAWIRLSWTTPQTVNRVVLYDRPNTDDWVTGGVLTFSDGTTVAVGSLNNAGGPVEVTFAARQITSVTFTVTAVGSRTYNIGLSEFQVFTGQ